LHNLTHYRQAMPLDDCRFCSETEKITLEDLLYSVLSHFKKYHPSGNLKFNNLGIFQSLKFRILMEKIFHYFKAKFHSKYFGLLWAETKFETRTLKSSKHGSI